MEKIERVLLTGSVTLAKVALKFFFISLESFAEGASVPKRCNPQVLISVTKYIRVKYLGMIVN